MVPRRHQSTGQASIPRDISGAPRYPLDAGLHHGHPGTPSASKRTLPDIPVTLPARVRGGAAMKPVDPFPRLLHAFFYEWMVQQRNASAHTVRSYRDIGACSSGSWLNADAG